MKENVWVNIRLGLFEWTPKCLSERERCNYWQIAWTGKNVIAQINECGSERCMNIRAILKNI